MLLVGISALSEGILSLIIGMRFRFDSTKQKIWVTGFCFLLDRLKSNIADPIVTSGGRFEFYN
jgi:hypothetical protein